MTNIRLNSISRILLTFILLFLGSLAFSQKGIGSISGTVIDSVSKKEMEYVTVSLLTNPEKKLVTGTITDFSGNFILKNIPKGSYILSFSFVGYQKKELTSIDITDDKKSFNLNEILLSNTLNLKQVVVKSDIPTVKYEIDKKVVSVENMNTTVGQTASEVLQNVPSIQTDIDGNILLRGNSGFTLLINGVPTAMEPNDALKSIPASTIKDIEIVTNPSARNQAEGAAGIINIITKKNKLKGISLLANVNVGNFDRYGADFNLNYKTDKHAFNLNASYNNRNNYREENEERVSQFDSSTTTIINQGVHNWGRSNYNVNGEWIFSPNDFNTISISSSIGRMYMVPIDFSTFWEYQNDSLVTSYYNKEFSDIWINTTSNSINFKHDFDSTTKKYISFTGIYNRRSVDEYVYSNFFDENNVKYGGNTGTEFGPSNLFRFNIDFVSPIKKHLTFETGIQTQFGISQDIRKNYQYDATTMEDTLMPLFSTDVTYNRNVHAGYVLVKGKKNKLGYQAGLRAEYTFRKIEANNISAPIQNIDRLDFFPSVHFSYQLNDDQQVLLSYSRRIERPRSYFFEPFLSFQSLYSVRTGNPSLLPEFINSFEVSWIKDLNKKGSISFEAYTRALSNLIRRIPSVYDTNIILTSPENVGNSTSTGLEGTITYTVTDFWSTNLGGNIYYYTINSTVDDNAGQRSESTNWNLRFQNTFTFLKKWKFQAMAGYNSKSVTALGEESDNFGLDLSLNRSFLDRKLSVTAQAQNVLATRRHIHTRDLNSVSVYNYSKPFAPVFMLTMSLSLNDYKKRYNQKENLDDF